MIVLTFAVLTGQMFGVEKIFSEVKVVAITVYVFAAAGSLYAWSQAEVTAKEK